MIPDGSTEGRKSTRNGNIIGKCFSYCLKLLINCLMKNNNNVAWKKHENKSPLRLGMGKWKSSIVRLLKCMWNDVISSVLAWLFEKSLDLSYITHDEGAGLGYMESPYSVCGSLTSALPWIVTTPKYINSSQVWYFESPGSFSDSSVYRYECLLCWDDPAEAAALWPLGLQDKNGFKLNLWINDAHGISPDFFLTAFSLWCLQAYCVCCALEWAGKGDLGETYPRGHSLQGSDVVLQSQAAAVIEHGFHSGHVRLHQLLSLVGCFLLQRFHFLLEMLPSQTHTHLNRELNK